MGCCQNKQEPTEQKAEGGCCGGGAMKKECGCKATNAISAFFQKLFGKKSCNCNCG